LNSNFLLDGELAMRIGIIGAGRIGGNAGRLFAHAGHEVLLSYSRDPAALAARAAEIGAQTGSPADAVAFGEVVMLSVPWESVDSAVAAAGPLDGRIVIDTTNQFGAEGLVKLPEGRTAAETNAARLPGARLVKTFNTMTAGFQAQAAGRPGDRRVAMFLAGEDEHAKQVVGGLVRDAGFEPVDLGGWGQVSIMEAPRRPGSVYGEEYRPQAARQIAAAVRDDPAAAAGLADRLKEPAD
jgi:8-hydroxy-5-deazaflavin:NADPH oxidoreductase